MFERRRSSRLLVQGSLCAGLLSSWSSFSLAGCTTASAETSARLHESSAPVVSATAASAPTLPDRPAPAAGPRASARMRVAYDLAAHVDHAELFRGPTRVIDLGEPSGTKYTLGGWGTRVFSGAVVEGVSASFVRGSYGDVLLPVEHTGPLIIEARVRAPRDGDVTVYLDDQVALRTKTAPDAFSTVRIDVPAGKLAPGEHMLRLRGSGMGKAGALSTAMLIDWVTVGPNPVEGLVPPARAALVPKPKALTIPAGYTLGYAVEVPAGARLLAGVSQGSGTLRAVGDGVASTHLSEVVPGAKLEVELSAFAGKVVRFDFSSSDGLTLESPRIAVPETTAPRAQVKPVRNVLIYLIDTLRADHLKPFNPGTRVRTPGLDQLVEQGAAVFARAHTQENWTKPSVATLLSSLLPWEHHAVTTEAVVPNDVKLLPELLKEHGFYSGAFIANGYVSDKFGFKQGWNTYRNYIREGRYSRAEFLAADVVQWLDKRPEKDPFFLYVHAIDPHVPYKPTAEFMHVYDPEPYQGVVNFAGDNELLEKIKIGKIKLNARDKVRLEALYDSEISYHDVHFRSILTALEKRGLSEDTMIVVVADHGEEFWDHGSVGHGHSVYEELLHIPMVIRVPSLTTKAVQVTSTSGLVDIVPTVLEAIGKQAPAGLSGRSLLPELRGDALSAPPGTLSGFMDGWRTVVIGNQKLIQRTEKRVMLHDLKTDPREQVDVAAQRPITVRYLRGQLGLLLAESEQAGQAPGSRKKLPKGQTTTIDAATEAQLRALGYVGTSRR